MARNDEQTDRLEFQTEAKELLKLVIHSLYSHKEIFVRELISNASDALDKLRFESLTNSSILGDDTDLTIRIKLDKKAKTFTISDNGIGMTRQEVIDNIGTIARSGTRAFMEKMKSTPGADDTLIGQFGVGFYSVFMVAWKVKLVTRRAGSSEPPVAWESDGVSQYTLREADKKSRGTEITLYLKEDEASFAEEWNIRSIIKKYSDFISFPIYLPNDKGKDEIVNVTKPLWKHAPAEITEEQYEVFYRHSLGGFGKPLCTMHSKAEGVLEYSYVLFIPEKAPFDLFALERKHGVKLYVKRVFITDDCKELLPEYLRFVKGVVDSEDLPLNVSRETLQHNPIISKMKNTLTGKILSKLKEIAEKEQEKYRTFWKQFGAVLKEGLHTDHENKERLLELIRFQSSMGSTEDDLVSLKEYTARMPEGQKKIYYITGENRQILQRSPHLEVFKAKNIEVLYLTDPIDEWIVNDIYNYDGKVLASVTRGDLDLGDLDKEEKENRTKAASTYKKLVERAKNILSATAKDVRLTARLKDSPCCLVTDEHDMGAHMEKIMKAMGQETPASKRILELNAAHPVVANLNALYEKSPTDPLLDQWINFLYDQALVAEGQPPRDPLAHSQRVYEMMLKAMAA